MPHLCHVDSHVSDTQKMTLDLGTRAIVAETYNLGANCHGVEVRVYFFHRIRDVFVNIFKKRVKNKKDGFLYNDSRRRLFRFVQ